MRITHYGRFYHRRVLVDGIFDFCSAKPVAGHVHHIVYPSDDAVVAVGIPPGAVAGEIQVFKRREIGGAAALVVAVGCAQDARPGEFEAKEPFNIIAFNFVSVGVNEARLHTRQGQGGKAGFGGRDARDRRNQHASGFCLPPGIHNGCFATANFFVIPVPGFCIDGLAHAAQDFDGRKIVALQVFIPASHQCPQGGRRSVEMRHFVLFANLPKPGWIGVSRNAFKHDAGGAGQQGAVNNIGVSGHPANIGGTPENIACFVLKNGFKGIAGVNHVAAAGVYYAFGFAG